MDKNKNLMNKLIRLQKEFFQLEGQKNTGERQKELKSQIDSGIFTIIGDTKQGEQYMKMLSSIKDQAMATLKERPPSKIEKATKAVVAKGKELLGYKKGGSVGYTQRWKNARKKNG